MDLAKRDKYCCRCCRATRLACFLDSWVYGIGVVMTKEVNVNKGQNRDNKEGQKPMAHHPIWIESTDEWISVLSVSLHQAVNTR